MQRLLDIVSVLAEATLGDVEISKEDKAELLTSILVRLSVLKERKTYFDHDVVLWAGSMTLANEQTEYENIVANRIANLKCQPTNSNAPLVTSPLTSSTI